MQRRGFTKTDTRKNGWDSFCALQAPVYFPSLGLQVQDIQDGCFWIMKKERLLLWLRSRRSLRAMT